LNLPSIKERIVLLRSKVPIHTTYNNGEDLIVATMNGVPGARSILLERCQSKIQSLNAEAATYSLSTQFRNVTFFYAPSNLEMSPFDTHIFALTSI